VIIIEIITFLLKDNTVVCVYNIAKSQNNNLYNIGQNLISDTNLFTPCESQHVGIAKQNRCIMVLSKHMRKSL